MTPGCGTMTERSGGAVDWRRQVARLAAAGAVWAALAPAAAAAPQVPAPSGRAIDLAEVLSPATESALAAMLAELESATGAQLVVLTIPSLDGEPIEAYSLRVAESWGLGSRERDDGVLLVVALEDRRTRIEVGYGLEGVLPDIVAGRIIRESMVPEFRRREYEAGVLAGARAIVDRLMPGGAEVPAAGEASELGVARPVPPHEIDWDLLWAWVVFLLLMPILGLVFALFAKEAEARGITFGALLLPLMLGGSLALDELVAFPSDSGRFLLGGVAVLALCSTVFWWLHFRLRERPERRAAWRERLERVVDGRVVLSGAVRWLRWSLVALFYLGIGAWIALFWGVGYAIAYVNGVLWLIVIYRATLRPGPSSDGSGSWSGRSARSVSTRGSSWSGAGSRSRASSTGGGGFRPGGGSFGGGGASGRW